MTTNDYIKELKSHLSVLENDKKNEIIQEIQSYIDESDVDHSLLVERFGTPMELANSYLEDIPIKEQTTKKIWSKTKKVLVILAISLTVLFAIIGIIIYNVTKDPFDYSKYNAKTIDEKVEAPWIEIDDINLISIDQARVIIYWSDDEKLKASCQGNVNQKIENRFEIKQSECFLKIPKRNVTLKSYQAKVVLVEPKSDVIFNSEQSRIKIDTKKGNYKFDLKGKKSDISNFKSQANGISISGTFHQSKLTKYEY